MESGEEARVCILIRDIFAEFVAPLYDQEGVNEFLRYIDPEPMAARARSNHFTLLAEDSNNIVGVIEMRDFNHVSLLFVAKDVQQSGIGRQLLYEGLEISRRNRPDLSEVSVHSSPNAVAAYEAMGFIADGPEVLENGIRYIPMSLRIAKDDA